MKKVLIIPLLVLCSTVFSQPILVTDADWDTLNPYNCVANPGPTANFFDSGNTGGNYTDNENEVMTICPDFGGGANKLGLTFGINVGLTFNVDGSDSVFVYDGPNTSSPLMGVHNSVTDPFGFTHQSSFGINPSGCLTIAFKSDAAIVGSGWDANVACLTLAQPFTAHMTGQLMGSGPDIISPADTGYSDICFGDSIYFTASGNFPYSLANTGHGYAQDSSNVTYEWTFSDGTFATGENAWFKPPARSGYLVFLKITDSFGQSQTIMSKVRVSTIPSFAGVINNRDSICVGDTTVIIGGVTNTDTAGVDPTNSNFQLGGTFAGLVYLPDGSGVNYTDTINISGFSPSQLMTAASDIDKFFVKMEHSYLGDLEMLLECPNGTQVNIFNSYSPGIIPGGFSGGGTYLGNAWDNNIGNPGVGMEYYFSTANATWGNMATEFAGGNTVPVTTPSNGSAMNPAGVYLPEQSFLAFATAGCPLNGKWTITIRDNLGTDDGYIFEWGIFFDPAINPNSETYVPSIVSSQWLSAATILPGLPTDTFIVVTSANSGTFGYTFEVTDNFGCTYDTTVNVYFLPTPSVQGDTIACGGQYQVVGTSSYNGGIWAYTGPGTASFFPSQSVENPLITVDSLGIYTFTFTDNQCLKDSSFQVNFVPDPTAQSDTIICDSLYQIQGTTSFNGGVWTYTGPGTATFTPSDTVENPTVSVNAQGNYIFTFTDNQCALANTFQIDFVPEPSIPVEDTVCGGIYQVLGTTSYNGGTWTFSGSGTATFIPSDSIENPLVTVGVNGMYTLTFTEKQCLKNKSVDIYFADSVNVNLSDAEFCIGDEVILDASNPVPDAYYEWSTGDLAPVITITDSGSYYVLVRGLCNEKRDTVDVNTIICDIISPNIITPNGDGNNDYLVFDGLEHYPESILVIFNRWGKKIYESNDYQNDWGPTDISDGTYFYILTPGGNLNVDVISKTVTVLK